MPRPRFAALALHLNQIDPAHLHAHGAAKLVAHPRCNRASQPLIAFWRWPTHGLREFREFRQLLRAEERLRAMGMRVLPIAHAVGAFGVIPFGDLPNPIP
jgi:hypothetical protein